MKNRAPDYKCRSWAATPVKCYIMRCRLTTNNHLVECFSPRRCPLCSRCRFLGSFILSVLPAVCAAGSWSLEARAGPSTYHQQYVPVDDPRAEKFVAEALAGAVEFLGKPVIPVRKVHLRQSTPIDPDSKLRRGFQRTELVDPEQGVFAIYLSRKPDEYSYPGQLAHEVGHLLNARLFDCYVEGLNTVFAEKFLKKKGLDWSGWDKHFRNGGDPIHAVTYFMMKDVAEAAAEQHVKTVLAHARWTDKERTRMHIDIDAWLATLPETRRDKVREAIRRHAPEVRKMQGLVKESYEFVLPK